MASKRFLFLAAFSFFLLTSLWPGGAPDLAADGAALLALRAAVGRSVLTWNASRSPCTWQGVECGSGRVTALRLPGVGLIGPIPVAAVRNLSALRTLSLRYNALSGVLPFDLPGLPELRNLYLQHNRFSGNIPPALGSVRNLIRFNLAGNQLSGEIPQELNNLTRLRTLYLENNRLSGSIPPLDLPNLSQFNVSFNPLKATIPSRFRTFPSSAFLSTGLCGRPLQPCLSDIPPSAALGAAGRDNGGGAGKGKNKLSGGAIAGIAIGSAAFILILLILLILLCRRSGKNRTSSLEAVETRVKQPEEAVSASEQDNQVGGSSQANIRPAPTAAIGGGKKLVFFSGARATFDLEDLLRASAEVLGKGTFGTTYKAVLEMGITVAVKRLKDVTLTEEDFREKVEVIGAIDHPNLVPLRAYYYSKDEKLLVYDYMPLGSLSALLHGYSVSGRTPLSWETRTGIALAAAYGIEYIQSTGSSTSHGNIKSSNVLLTKSFEAHVSDHGLALLAGPSSSSTRIVGYRAPEVTDARMISQKADVYSFGVLLMELLSGKAPAQALNDEGIDLPRWVQSIVPEEWATEVFDPELLRYQTLEEDMVQFLQLAVDCTAQHPDKRPSMTEVVARMKVIQTSRLKSLSREQHNSNNSIEVSSD
ncbi:probable inactive receptor kinase At1g48480 [Zingiber officinale]|uniref:probable inactive receptor kinase At1g48480 n=1 Tax=Zingiber officinale TaxID=94328 RepID=UPI001C4BDCDA|nr:probable inactive receptor kinase At1g48480 [Zingiber officinale]